MPKPTKLRIYTNMFCIFTTDFPHLFNPLTPKPLAYSIKAQLYDYYDKELSLDSIHLFLGVWTNRIEYHRSVLREDYRTDLIDKQFKIFDTHKKHAFKSTQRMLKPLE